MALKITDECISCGACEPACPNEAITAGDTIYVIDADLCTECLGFFGTQQCLDVCPVSSIINDPDHPEEKGGLLEKFRSMHPGKEPKDLDSWRPVGV